MNKHKNMCFDLARWIMKTFVLFFKKKISFLYFIILKPQKLELG